MATTPAGLPYPALTDAPDVSYWMQQLAQAVDTRTVNKPRCKLVAAATQSLTGSPAVVDFAGGSVTYDTNGMADIPNDQIVIKTAGWYRISGRLVFASNATGYRALVVQKNGVDFIVDDYRPAVSGTVTIITVTSEPILLAVNDTIRLMAAQNNSPMTLITANGRYSHLAVDWVAGQ